MSYANPEHPHHPGPYRSKCPTILYRTSDLLTTDRVCAEGRLPAPASYERHTVRSFPCHRKSNPTTTSGSSLCGNERQRGAGQPKGVSHVREARCSGPETSRGCCQGTRFVGPCRLGDLRIVSHAYLIDRWRGCFRRSGGDYQLVGQKRTRSNNADRGVCGCWV